MFFNWWGRPGGSAALAQFVLTRLFQSFLGKKSTYKSSPSSLAIREPMVFSAFENVLDSVLTSACAVTTYGRARTFS